MDVTNVMSLVVSEILFLKPIYTLKSYLDGFDKHQASCPG